jgi:hypothetical protein
MRGDEILREVLREEAERGEAGYQILDDEKALQLKARRGHLILVYPYSVETGAIAPMFDTIGFADYMVEQCAELLDEYLDNTSAKKTDGTVGNLSEIAPSKEARMHMAEALSHFAIRHFIRSLQPKLWHALQEHELETFVLTRGLIENSFASFLSTLPPRIDARTRAARLAEQIKSERGAFLKGSLDRLAGRPNYDRLKEHYERLLPKWQRAKTVYESISDLPNWRDTISQILEGENPDAFLIARVSGRLEDLPDKIKAAISEAGGDSSASSIAIEHAARLCGAKHYALNARTLFRKMQKAAGKQKVIKTKGVH